MTYIIENFFTNEECNTALTTISSSEQDWKKCHQTSMYVLGNSLFRKLKFDNGNPTYSTYFNDNTYFFKSADLLKEKLKTQFKEVTYTKNFSRPGFQLIKRNEDSRPSVWHYDNMITCFPYELEFKDYNNDFSNYFDEYYIFTLMLSDEVGSFDYYPETESTFGKDIYEASTITPICKQHVNLVGDNCSSLDCTLKDYKTLYYNKGSLLVQNNRVLHRVGNRDINGNNTIRATLQTYGVVKDETLFLFW